MDICWFNNAMTIVGFVVVLAAVSLIGEDAD